MNIELNRKIWTNQSTVGKLSVDGKFQCYILEDVDRECDSLPLDGEVFNQAGNTTPLTAERKVYGKTAIPRGTYKIVVTQSARFGRKLPLLVDVPLFEGVRIHPGNKPADTDGCLLPGKSHTPNWVSNSTQAWAELFDKIMQAANANDTIWITVK